LANHKSAAKRALQAKKRNEHSKARKTAVRTEIKKLRDLIATKSKAEATKQLVVVQSKLAKLSKTSIMHKKTAARKTSRVAQQVAAL